LLVTPKIATRGAVRQPIQAVSWSRDGKLIAVARHGRVELLDGGESLTLALSQGEKGPGKAARELSGLRGVVNDVGFSTDGNVVFTAAGEPGLFGEVRLFNVADGSLIRVIQGHRDAIYAAEFSPDGKLLATGSYDQKVKLWEVATGQEVRTLHGHNDAVYDVAFHPNGQMLASASGDRTVKLWNVSTGERLDTLNQPEKEQYAVVFSVDGKRVVAGGVDKRIRVWDITAGGKEGTRLSIRGSLTKAGFSSWRFHPTGRCWFRRPRIGGSKSGRRSRSRSSRCWRLSRTGRRHWPSRRIIFDCWSAAWMVRWRATRSPGQGRALQPHRR
jgi:WD40 repeat protein